MQKREYSFCGVSSCGRGNVQDIPLLQIGCREKECLYDAANKAELWRKDPRAGPCPPGYCFQNYGGVCKKQSQFVFTETTYGDDSEKVVFSFSDMIIPLSLTKVSRGKNTVLADFPKKEE